MPACPYIRRFVHPSARSFAGRPVCAAEALRRLCVATHRLRTAAGVCIVRRIASRPLHPPHCLPSAVSAAPRCIDAPFIPALDAPFIPAPRPPHCVSSAASAALPPVRRVRRAPLHRRSVHSRAPSAALCLFRCIRRIASRPPCPPRPVCPRRIRHACAELRDPAHPRVRSVSSACSPRLRLSGSSAAAAPCPSHVLAPMPPPDGRRGPPGIKNKY